MDPRPTPLDTDVPGGFPVTPSVLSSRSETPITNDVTETALDESNVETPRAIHDSREASNTYFSSRIASNATDKNTETSDSASDALDSVTIATKQQQPSFETCESEHPKDLSQDETPVADRDLEGDTKQPPLPTKKESNADQNAIYRKISRRQTAATNGTAQSQPEEDDQEVHRLMSRMFGNARQQSSNDQIRHSGVIFRNLIVKGVGLGAALQPVVGDVFMGLPRAIRGGPGSGGKPPVRDLITGFDGCVRPGELLLVLGRPGSGCTTFLKAFCNQRAGFQAVEGDVTYGGATADDMAKRFRGEIIYNPEDDLHYATLSVRRTLTFALQTRTPGKEARLEGESRSSYVKEFLRVVTKLFWIEHTLGTKVGNEFIRGVSGGERKRVSIAEAMITRASVQGWDNSSKGLDASTALEYIRSIRAMTNMANTSTAVSLYQAGESLYDNVDKVLLIDSGKCLYFGPANKAKQYFMDLGFECPERWTTADFLTSVTDEHERSIRSGWEDRIPRSPDAFAEAYRSSEVYKANLADMDDFEAQQAEQIRVREEGEQKKISSKNYTLSFQQQVSALIVRQFYIMLGDKGSLFSKWGGIVFMGLIFGSLFYNLPSTAAGAFTRGGALFMILLFNTLLAIAEMSDAFENKPILLKHKSFSFYRPGAFAFAQSLVDVPLVFIQVFLFTLIIYFMAGLAQTASQFFIAILFVWLCTMTSYAFFRAIASWAGTLDGATA